MPTISGLELPRPSDWQEFERMVAAALRLRWDSQDIQMNGRPGQVQHGIDIFGKDNLQRFTGIQCKLTTISINIDIVRSEIDKAEKFKPEIQNLYIATTSERDAKLQSQILAICEERIRLIKFPVGIIYYNEIIEGLARDPKIMKLHFPQIDLNLGVRLPGSGGYAFVNGNLSGATGGNAGESGACTGGSGGDATVHGDLSYARGGDGSNAPNSNGRGGRRSKGPSEYMGHATEFWKYGYGGAGANTPEYDRRLSLLTVIRQEYLNSFPDDAVFINAGIDIVPINWVNARLQEKGEFWSVDIDHGGYIF